ncbi:CDP-glycerol glycerophosphotransferase family protein [Actinoplanes subglobosus]|uniref:CDP-glycerol glycerophosphotransferase family protein n=1 Tax=Actinoplanes subglobosus TaxID=1547892 RepID=A0ABV8IVZ0_9ACTN
MSELVPGLVSVIVPIYNVEPFLRDCLDSLRAQTYTDLQVILVDDGSTDGSPAIAEEYVAADPRFQLIRQANAGLSAARNAGVPSATGEFLAFVDSDDLLAAHAYEVLVGALEGGADFATGGVVRLTSRGTHRGAPHKTAITKTKLDAHVSVRRALLADRTIWNKLFRRSFYDQHGFEFPVGRLYEDAPVTVPAHALANKVAVVAGTVYFWRLREGAVRSITQSGNDLRNLVDRFHSIDLAAAALAAAGKDELRQTFLRLSIQDQLSNYFKFLPSATPEFQSTFMKLSQAYLKQVDPAAISELPVEIRPHWKLINQGRFDDLIELIDHGYRLNAKPVKASPVEAVVRSVTWENGKLVLAGSIGSPAAQSTRPGRLKVFWASNPAEGRRIPIWSRSQTGGFVLRLKPESLRSGSSWQAGQWTIAAAVNQGLQLRKTVVRVPTDWTEPMPRIPVAPGVWVMPYAAKGDLRISVVKADGWLTGTHREGDDLILSGRLRQRRDSAQIRLCRAAGIVTHTVDAEIAADGREFTARVPLAWIALDVRDDNHAEGHYGQRFLLELVTGETVRLMAGDEFRGLRTAYGSDEVFTTVAESNRAVSIATRPQGPVVTAVRWQPNGALVLSGDSPIPAEGQLLLRMRGRRKDLGLPLKVVDGHWEVTVDPAGVPTLAGRLPLVAGTWDLTFRAPGHRHETTTPLAFDTGVLESLPLDGPDNDGVRGRMRGGTNDRAVLDLIVPETGPEEHARLLKRYFPASGRPALRDVVLLDAAPGRRFFDDPAALLAELRSRPDAPEVLWTVDRGQPLPDGVEAVSLGSPAWYSALATSRWVVTNDNLPLWFRPATGQVVLRLAGGWPVARSGALASAHPLGQTLIDQLRSDAASWTAVASPSPTATPVLREEFGFDGTVLEYGRPANDLLSAIDRDAAKAHVLQLLGLPEKTSLVLYAPTRRPSDLRRRGASDPGRLLDLLGVASALPADHRLLVRRHPGVPDDVMGQVDGVLDVTAYPQVSELLLATDMLVTDYSALLADYASTGRPALLYVPDLEEFEGSPGLNVDLEREAPGPLLRESSEVAAALQDIPAIVAEHRHRAEAFAATHGAGGEGGAAAKLVDWMMAAGR